LAVFADRTATQVLTVSWHTISAVKEMYLDRFAEVFAAGDLGVLVFDNRNSGERWRPPPDIDPCSRCATADSWPQINFALEAD